MERGRERKRNTIMWKLSLVATQKAFIAQLDASREIWQTTGAYDPEQHEESPAVRGAKGTSLCQPLPHAAHAPWKPPNRLLTK